MTNAEVPTPRKPFPLKFLIILAVFSVFSDVLKSGYKLAKNADFLYTDQLFSGILIAIVIILLIFKIRKRINKVQVEKIINPVEQAIYEESKAGQEEKASRRVEN